MNWLYIRNTFLFRALCLVFILNVSIDAQGEAPKCPIFKVLRGIIYKVCINKPLKISCSLKYCDDKLINITWTKSDDWMENWIPVTETDQISISQQHFDLKNLTSYLSFTNIAKHHEGLYRCELKLPHVSPVSHHINVSVSDGINETKIFCTEVTKSSISGSVLWWLPYVCICLGVVILVFMVVFISILCDAGFKRSRQKRQKLQHTGKSTSTSTCPDATQVTQPSHQSTPNKSHHGDNSLSRGINRSSQVIYASLNHFTPVSPSSTSCRTALEFSEYAPIRVS